MNRLPLALFSLLITVASGAQESPDSAGEPIASAYRLSGTEENARLSYQGDATRFGIGVDDDGDVYGEFFYLFNDNPEAAWLGEGWVSRGAGGLKLNYHWLRGSLEQAIEAEAQAQAICMQTADFERAYRAFVAKEKPVFEGN